MSLWYKCRTIFIIIPIIPDSDIVMAMVISIASQKGGTGKTSTSISLAAGLARKGKRTLLIDIDSQANSSKVLGPPS
jgi:Mrp family chromosome partitioning ATPase